MTPAECMAILAVAGVCYDREVTEDMARAWATMLADVTPVEGRAALEEHVRTSPHWPKISDIATRVASYRSPAPDVGAAWEEVWRAVHKCGYNREPGTLDERTGDTRPGWSSPRIAGAVDALGWRTICHTDVSDLPTLRAQFERYYRAGVETARRDANVGALERSRSNQALPVGELIKRLGGE